MGGHEGSIQSLRVAHEERDDYTGRGLEKMKWFTMRVGRKRDCLRT